MEIQNKAPHREGETDKKEKVSMGSIQYSSNDLDQEQNCDLNPVQTNTQNVHVYVTEKDDYSSKITGTTYMERDKEIAPNVKIVLYIGHEFTMPVFKCTSDENGNFLIPELPAGYYTLNAYLNEYGKTKSHFIKVLPCQNVYQSIFLD